MAPQLSMQSNGKACAMSSRPLAQADPQELLQTLEDLQSSITAAMSVNSHLNAEVERYLIELDQASNERDAWRTQCTRLARLLRQARKHAAAAAATSSHPQDSSPNPAGSGHNPNQNGQAQAPAQAEATNADGVDGSDDSELQELSQMLQLPAPCRESLGLSASSPEQNRQQQQQHMQGSAGGAGVCDLAATACEVLLSAEDAAVLAAWEERKQQHAAASTSSSTHSSSVNGSSQNAAGAGTQLAAANATGLNPAATPTHQTSPFMPSLSQARLVQALVERGRALGWLLDPAEVTRGSVLGEGEFGTTYRGSWRGADVAVKVVRVSQANELTMFLREVEAMSTLRHPHIVPFLGTVLQPPDTFWLLSEFMTGGTMTQKLYPNGSGQATFHAPPLADRIRMAWQVCQGMVALEACNPPILHRDLKPSNIFIDGAGYARIGDFGLSRRLLPGTRASLTGETGTYLYMSPEVMRHEVYCTKADVWSWGVLLAESLTGTPPYAHTYMTPVQIACAVAAEQLSPHVPSSSDVDLQVCARAACDFSPDSRPTFAFLAMQMAEVVARMKVQAGQEAGVMGRLQRSLATGWGGVLTRIYGATPASGAVPTGEVAAAAPGGVIAPTATVLAVRNAAAVGASAKLAGLRLAAAVGTTPAAPVDPAALSAAGRRAGAGPAAAHTAAGKPAI